MQAILRWFVQAGIKIYGKGWATFNVHSLLHLHEDADLYGELDNVSCFPFENFLGCLKNRIRNGKVYINVMDKIILFLLTIMYTYKSKYTHKKVFMKIDLSLQTRYLK